MSTFLPHGWTWVPVGDLVARPSDLTDGPFGSNLKTEHYRDSGPRVIRLQNIGDGCFIDDKAHISREHFARLRKHDATHGDVVVAMLGSDLPRACLVPSTLGPAIVKADCVRLRPDDRVIDGRYAVPALNSPAVRRQAGQLVHGVGRPRLGLKWFRDLRVPLAPPAEQLRLVDAIDSYLSRLDVAVASLEAAQHKLTAYRASVLKAAVEGRLVPTEAELARTQGRPYEPADALLDRILKERRRRWEEAELAKLRVARKTPKDDRWKAKYSEPEPVDVDDLPNLPEGWCWATCGQILESLQTGPFGSTLHRSDYVTGGVPVINPEHLRRYAIEPSERVTVHASLASRLDPFRLSSGAIVLGRRGEMGRCAVVGEREDGWLLGTGSLALRPATGIAPRFLAWVLRSPHGVRTLSREAIGTTMTNLNQEILRALPVPLPPCSEQLRIVDEIDRQFSLIENLERVVHFEVARSHRVRQGILKWAFEGKLVDQDPNDEPADLLIARVRAERAAATVAQPKPKRSRKLKVAS